MVKQGAHGSTVYSLKEGDLTRLAVPACPEIAGLSIVDTTGAGDTFTAAYAVKSSQGFADEAAIEFASAAAYLTITKVGVADAIPTLESVTALLAQISKN